MNSGTVNFNSGASSVAVLTFSSGNLNAAGGTVSLPTYTHNGGALRLNGGSVTVAGTLNLAGGSIVGGTPGTLTADINQTGGTISPGLSPGVLDVTGNFTQAAGADINLEIFGTGGPGAANGHDQINITGDATTDGDFNVTVDPGYTPTLGDTFTVAMASGTTMGNNTLNLPDISAFGFEFSDAGSTPNALILEVVALSGCTINFDNDNGNGLWQEATNWDSDVVPALADDVCIGVGAGPLAGPFTVIKSAAAGTDNINSLTVADGQGVFTLSSALTLANASTIGMGGFMHTSGTLDGADLTINGVFDWSGGTQGGTGMTVANGGIVISGSGVKGLNARTLVNNAMASWSGTGSLSVSNNATLNSAGTFDIQTDADVLGLGTFNNTGALTKTSGLGVAETIIGLIFNNSTGTVDVAAGRLSFSGGGTSTGTFNVAVTGTLQFSGGTHHLNSGAVVSGAGTTSVSGATTVNFNVGSNITTPVAITSGVLNTTPNLTLPSLNVSGGTLVSTGDVTVTGATAWLGGTISGGSAFNPDGGLTISGGVSLTNGRTLNNNGTTVLTATGTLTTGGGLGATINNNAGATFDIQSNGGFLGGFAGANVFNNAGTLMKSGGGGVSTANGVFNNMGTGTVNANSGTLTLATGGTSTGAFNVAGGATLQFSGGTYDLNSGATVSGAGTTNFSGAATVNVNGGSNITTPVTLLGGTVNVTPDLTLPTLTQSGGTLTGSGDVTVTGATTWPGGTVSGTGAFNPDGGLTISGNVSLRDGRTLNNNGTTALTGTLNTGGAPGATINNNGTFDIQADFSFLGGLGGASAFNNIGTLTKSLGAGVATAAGAFNNTGIVNADSGVVNLAGGGTSNGAFNVAGRLQFSGGTHDLTSGATVSGTGVTGFSGGQANFAAGSNITTAAEIMGGVANIAPNVTLPSLSQTSGTLMGSGAVTVTGATAWAGGIIRGPGALNPDGGLIISGSVELRDGRTLNNNASALLLGTLTTGGTPGATINNNGSFDIQADVAFLGGFGGTNTFNNSGMLTKSAGAGTATATGDVNNTGTVNANMGTLSVTGSFTQSGGASLTRLNGGNLGGGITFAFNGGVLDAVGSSTITGNVNNAGATVRPGMSPGLLAITGTYTQGALGVLDIELGGTGAGQFDVLAIGGAATLGGTLNVISFGGFTPVAGNSFQVMTYASFTGDFTTKNGLNISTPPLTATPQPTFYSLQVPAPAMADLAVTKADSPDPILLGSGDITYTVMVTNNGPDAATNVMLTDTLPGSVTFVSATPSQGACTTPPVAGVLTCNLGTINNAANATVTIVVTPTAGGMITNTASVSATEADPAPANNSDTETTTVNTLLMVDLAVTKADSPDPAVVGQNITYTVTVSNGGPDAASNATLTDTLLPAAGIAFVSATPSQGTCTTPPAGNILTCDLGAIANGANATVIIVITPLAAGVLINTASVTTTDTDSNSANNTDTETSTVIQAATATAVVSSLNPSNSGDNVTFTATVSVSAPGAGTPTGTVDFFDGAANIGSGTVNAGGQATFATSTLAAGMHSITATYNGDANFTGSTSPAITQTVNPLADLSVSKTDTPDPVTVGQNITYTITVANAGPSAATNVTVTDPVPAGVTFAGFVSLSQGSAVFSGGTNTVTGSFGTINSGANATLAFRVSTSAASVPSVSNTATVSATENDPNTANNSDTETTTVNPPTADLAVTKTDAPDPATAGQNVSYTITVTNSGPDPATNASLMDAVPANTTFVSFTAPAGWTSTTPPVGGTGTVTATHPSLAAGTPQVFTLVVATSAASAPSISNTATVSAAENDPNSANNSDTETTTVNLPSADVSVTKTDTPDPVTEGQNITYTITVANAGPSPATNVTVTDPLPAGVTFAGFVSVSQGGAVFSGGTNTVTGSFGTINSGANATLAFRVSTSAASVPSVSNTATVSATENDPNTANNSDTETTTVNPPTADLAVTKTDAPDPATAGQNVSYTITVTNSGPDPATNASLMDAVPANSTFVSFTAPAGWTSTTPAVGGTGTVTATSASLAAGTPQVFTLVVATTGAAAPSISNTATVSATEADPTPANNSATATTTVNPLTADLSVTKTDTPDPATAGQNVSYTITVTNSGPDPATNASLMDAVPANTTFVSFTAPAGWTSTTPAVGGTGTVTATRPNLAAGTPQVFTLVVATSAASAPSISNTAIVSAAENDPNSANNSDTETTAVNLVADISVTKSDAADPVNVGQNIVYTVTVANAGPDAATAVMLTDTLPAAVTFVSAVASQGACGAPVGVTLSCNLGTIASGGNASVTITVTAGALAAPSVTNTASATTTSVDPNVADNTDTETTTVNPIADLAITKTDAPDPVSVGSNITYTIQVTNNGPSPATGVTVSDPIPAGLTFVSATGPAGVTCMQAGGTITCTLAGMLNSGANVTATVIVTTTAAAAPSVSNTATVSSMITDPNPANNSATATTTVSATPPANDFSLVVQPINNNVVVGQDGTFQAVVTSLPAGSNFANPVDLMCISLTGACTVAPPQLAAGVPSGTVMITVRTADLLGSAPPAPSAPGLPPAAPLVALWTFLASLMLVSLGVIGRKTQRRRMAHCMSFGLALLVASFAIGQSACATSPGRQVAGPYTVTVTATSGTVSHSATVTLNVTDR